MKRFLLISFLFAPLLCFAETATNFPGLICTATDGQRKATFVVPTPHFTLKEGQSIHPQLNHSFEASWDGFLRVARAGKYLIEGNARIFVGGTEVANHEFTAGEPNDYPFHIEFHRPAGEARLQLYWRSTFFAPEPLPASVLFHRENLPELQRSEKIAHGRELFEEFNCAGCHRTEKKFFQSRPAPDLTGVGSRLKSEWIYKWLENPRHFRSEARMPVLLKKPQLRADVTAFLASLKMQEPPKAEHGTDVSASKKFFNSVGCIACHDDSSLAGIGSKMNADQLANYLRDPLKLDPSGRMPDMLLSDDEAAHLAAYLVQSKNVNFEEPIPPGDAARGQQFFGIIGCANCHTLEIAGEKVSPGFAAASLEQLNPGNGCLAETPPQFAPDYHFTPEERDALNAFIESPDISEAPIVDFQRITKKLQCAACHELYAPAKLTLPPNQSPPRLTDAGNKFRRSWLERVFVEKKRIRPWLNLRMPHFGAEALNPLLDDFAAQSGAALGEGERIVDPDISRVEEGVHLVGRDDGGFSCITCHDFRDRPALGEVRGPDLTKMNERIRVDWIARWLRDPARIVPGTTMPNFFEGKHPDRANWEIGSILNALTAGDKMPIPAGVYEDDRIYVVTVTNEPVIMRCFLPDSSPRSIAIGFPGQISCCFDAESCRVRYAWTGEFLSMKPTWSWRGGKPPRVLGEKFYIAPDEFPLRIGDRAHEPKVKFVGYDLVKKYPEFRYEVDGVLVRERISDEEKGRALVRHFDLGEVKQDIWFNGGPEAAMLADPLPAFSDGWWKISGGKSVLFQVVISTKNRTPH